MTLTANRPIRHGSWRPSTQMKILVAEDDRATLTRIKSLLQAWGHECLSARDGRAAWELYHEQRPRFVISDWLMPGLDGIEFLGRIRSTGACPYFIMLTSRGDTSDLVEAMDAGADDYLSKPFANEELRVRVRAGVRMIEHQEALERKNQELVRANLTISAANRRMKSELEAAARVQDSYLPRNLPLFSHAHFAWHFEPCEELSGDAFNILRLGESKVGMYVADVSGHGVASSLLSVQLSRLLTQIDQPDSLLRSHSRGESELCPPSEVAAHLNQLFPLDQDQIQYFTFLYGILDLDQRIFRYTSAGHSGPIIVRADGAQIQPPCPPAIGFFPDARFSENQLSLGTGDRIYLYTDGVFEICNDSGEEIGENRIARLLAERRSVPLDSSLAQVVEELHRWAGNGDLADDLSLVAVEID